MCVFNVETVVVSRLQSRRNKHPWFDDVMVKGRACWPKVKQCSDTLPPFSQPSFLSSLFTFYLFWHWFPDTDARFPIMAFVFQHFHSFSLLSSITFPLADAVAFLPPPSLACHYLIFAHLSSLSPVSTSLLHLASPFCPSVLGSSTSHFPSTPLHPSIPPRF